ncbi:MAG: hypothetical protein RL595_79, partial [Planctomycetota bacterium]
MNHDRLHDKLLYPDDRRIAIRIQAKWMVLFAFLAIAPAAVAWGQYLCMGLPEIVERAKFHPESAFDPVGFPIWIRLTHFVNFFMMVLLVRSGISILMDHPRLYWNDHSTPGSDWLRFTPVDVPKDRI